MTVPVVILILISQLGSDSYPRRERAQIALLKLAPWAENELRVALRVADAEIRQRSYEILSHFYRQSAADKASRLRPPCGYPRLPWVDMLPDYRPDRTATIRYYLGEAHKQMGQKGPPEWDDYRLATRIYATDLLGDPDTAGGVGPLLDEMAAREIQWIKQNAHRYTPPLRVPGR